MTRREESSQRGSFHFLRGILLEMGAGSVVDTTLIEFSSLSKSLSKLFIGSYASTILREPSWLPLLIGRSFILLRERRRIPVLDASEFAPEIAIRFFFYIFSSVL